MRVLFVSRKHPPSVGGMEKLSYHLVESTRARSDAQVNAIVWKHNQRFLLCFFFVALFASVRIGSKGIDIVHIGDPVLAWLGVFLRAIFRVPIVITVHGLDLTYPFFLYRLLVSRWVKSYDRVICISRIAQTICLERGVDPARCQVVHPGVDVPPISANKIESRAMLAQWLQDDLRQSKLIVTVGRLVPRKGVYFFVKNVLPELARADRSFMYLIVGEGRDKRRIQAAIAEQNLESHVRLLGRVDARLMQMILQSSDLFVAPNIAQPNDVEGFGLVVLEAAAQGCPVLVADLEGLRDTLPANCQDWMVPAGDAALWSSKIMACFQSPEHLQEWGKQVREFVSANFPWQKMGEEYWRVFQECVVDAQSG